VSEGRATAAALRVFLADAAEVTPDQQGRIVVPQRLRTYAELSRDVAVVGQTNHIEIWDAGRFADVQATKSSAEVSTEIRRLRIF
jgi:MraZ protein